MKKLISIIILLLIEGTANAVLKINPITGRLDVVGTEVSSSTLPSGSTNYVQVNPASQQSGGFNISTGVVGQLSVSTISINTTNDAYPITISNSGTAQHNRLDLISLNQPGLGGAFRLATWNHVPASGWTEFAFMSYFDFAEKPLFGYSADGTINLTMFGNGYFAWADGIGATGVSARKASIHRGSGILTIEPFGYAEGASFSDYLKISGPVLFERFSKSDLAAGSPPSTGTVAGCSDCTYDGLVIATGTSTGQWARISDLTQHFDSAPTVSGGASALEVFSNFDGTQSSPTSSISIGDALKLSVSGSTAIVTVDFSSVPSRSDVILNQNTLQSNATFYVSSGTVSGNLRVGGSISLGDPPSTSRTLNVNGNMFVSDADPSAPTIASFNNPLIGWYPISNRWAFSTGDGFNDLVVFDPSNNVIYPGLNNTDSLGKSGTVWANVYATNGIFTNITGSLPAASVAAGSLGSSVLASSFPVTGVTAGSYTNTNLTVNAQGIVTAASNGTGSSASASTHTYSFSASGLQGTRPLTSGYDGIPPVAQSTGTNANIWTATYDDTDDECRGFSFRTPYVIGGGSVTFQADWFSQTATSGAVEWMVALSTVTNGSSWDLNPVVYAAASSSVDSTVREITQTKWSTTVATAGMASEMTIQGWICRDGDGTNGTDSMVGDAHLINFSIGIPRQ